MERQRIVMSDDSKTDFNTGSSEDCEISSVSSVDGTELSGRVKDFLIRARYFEGKRLSVDRRCILFANFRLVLFLASFSIVTCVWREYLEIPWLFLGIFLIAAFVVVASYHSRLIESERRLQALARINLECVERLKRHFDTLPSDLAFECGDIDRFFLLRDLGILGKKSIFRLMDRSSTETGSTKLCEMLSAAKDVSSSRERQTAVRELLEKTDFRESLEIPRILRFFASKKSAKKKEEQRIAISRGSEELRQKCISPGRSWLLAARMLPAATLSAWILWACDFVTFPFWGAGLFLQVLLAILFSRTPAACSLHSYSPLGIQAVGKDLSYLFSCVERADFSAARLRYLQKHLTDGDISASRCLKKISSLLSLRKILDQPLLHFPLAALFFFDVFLADSVSRCAEACSGRFGIWADALAEIEALSSLAGYADLSSSPVWPDFCGEASLSALSLGHPLIPENICVRNDVFLGEKKDGPISSRALIITGSNMAGKTTFLRSLGVNVCIALAGGSVCAKKMTVGPLQVVTSMGITDSLEDGLSLFHAEVRRMKKIMDKSKEEPILFLLDEILHGTNTFERRQASKAILRALILNGGIGAVATHDIELAGLADEMCGLVRNVHFTDSFDGDRLSFDYRMRDGVVQTTNALRIMRREGIEIPELDQDVSV